MITQPEADIYREKANKIGNLWTLCICMEELKLFCILRTDTCMKQIYLSNTKVISECSRKLASEYLEPSVLTRLLNPNSNLQEVLERAILLSLQSNCMERFQVLFRNCSYDKFPASHLQGRLLLLDSHEGHKSVQIKQFVANNSPNIRCCVIPGVYTDVLQPLHMGTNTVFKRTARRSTYASLGVFLPARKS